MVRCSLMVMVVLFVVLATFTASAGSGEGGASKTGPSAVEVVNRVQETDLTTVKLSPEAEQRLAVKTVSVEVKAVARTRVYPGEVLIPPGRAIVASAPVAGLVSLAAGDSAVPSPCTQVAASQAVLTLIPGAARDGDVLATSDRISLVKARADVLAARVEAEGRENETRVQVEAAQVKLERADTLRKQNAGSQRSYDEALAELELAKASNEAAAQRLETLKAVLGELEEGRQAAIPIVPSIAGMIRAVHVAPGQVVPSGAMLFEVVALDSLWVRVPVYVGDINLLDAEGSVQVRGLADRPGSESLSAKRVYPPGSADAAAATVDFFFEVNNADGRLRPGQRMGVALRTRDRNTGPIVPDSAVLYDIYGGTWVYERVAPQTYVRRRVIVRDIVDGSALLARGLEPGVQVVTDGAAELFGTEFGAGK